MDANADLPHGRARALLRDDRVNVSDALVRVIDD
jgi:hypothetical protein